jgi:hypothetical protein
MDAPVPAHQAPVLIGALAVTHGPALREQERAQPDREVIEQPMAAVARAAQDRAVIAGAMGSDVDIDPRPNTGSQALLAEPSSSRPIASTTRSRKALRSDRKSS